VIHPNKKPEPEGPGIILPEQESGGNQVVFLIKSGSQSGSQTAEKREEAKGK